MRFLFFAPLAGVACTVASGCERAPAAREAATAAQSLAPAWEWEKAAGESVVRHSKIDEADLEILRRCWTRPSGYDCIYLSRGGEYYIANRYQMSKLNRGSEDDPTFTNEAGGYSCTFFPGRVHEAIGGAKGHLSQNIVSLLGGTPSQPWTAEHVATFMRDNAIDRPNSHFDCTELASQVLNSSVATVGSTNISYAQLMK